MALSIKHDPEQWQQLIDAINNLSANLGKHEALTREVIKQGLGDLLIFLGGTDSEALQQRIDSLTESLKPEADAFERAAQIDQPTNEGDS